MQNKYTPKWRLMKFHLERLNTRGLIKERMLPPYLNIDSYETFICVSILHVSPWPIFAFLDTLSARQSKSIHQCL